MVDLKVSNLHWLENLPEELDKCAHGSVYLKIGDRLVSNEDSGSWTVSSSAYYFLKSLNEVHDENSSSQLLPCCGHSFYIVGKYNDELMIFGCPNGITWKITRGKEKIVHQFEDGEIIEINFDEWRSAVCRFSDQIMSFYETSFPKKVEDENDRKAFELFMSEWKRLRTEAFD